MEGEEIFGSYKQNLNLALGLERDSHRDSHVNFFYPCANHVIEKLNVEIEQSWAYQIHGDVEVLQAPCGDGVWHIKRCPLMSHVQCSAL
jgi:hypothetical protein